MPTETAKTADTAKVSETTKEPIDKANPVKPSDNPTGSKTNPDAVTSESKGTTRDAATDDTSKGTALKNNTADNPKEGPVNIASDASRKASEIDPNARPTPNADDNPNVRNTSAAQVEEATKRAAEAQTEIDREAEKASKYASAKVRRERGSTAQEKFQAVFGAFSPDMDPNHVLFGAGDTRITFGDLRDVLGK